MHLFIETLGWLAAALTVASYAVRTMLPLRILAILSSLAFVTYAVLLSLWPMVVMELILLPFNIWRLWEIVVLRRKVNEASQNMAPDFSVIKAYGKRRIIPRGTAIFQVGDAVDQLYFIEDGTVRIDQAGVDLVAGDIFGEIAFFTDAATRTATATAQDEVTVFELDKTAFLRLQFQDPSFGLAVMRTVTRRLIEAAEKAAARASSARAEMLDPGAPHA